MCFEDWPAALNECRKRSLQFETFRRRAAPVHFIGKNPLPSRPRLWRFPKDSLTKPRTSVPSGSPAAFQLKLLEGRASHKRHGHGADVRTVDEGLMALVRQVMPPRAEEWDRRGGPEASRPCAIFNRKVLRIYRDWSTAIYDAGLHFVGLVEPEEVTAADPCGLASRIVVDAWQACTISADYEGRFFEKRGS
ncbi:hypothetical protein ACVIGB_008083 [Bradyrhizobium sp. USDA 4341]